IRARAPAPWRPVHPIFLRHEPANSGNDALHRQTRRADLEESPARPRLGVSRHASNMTLGTRILPVVALALLSATEAISGISDQSIRSPGGSVLSVPIGSPAQFASFGQHEAARFKGRFKLQGTYRYGYLTNDPDADSIYGVLELT